jgi:hypothetical protein
MREVRTHRVDGGLGRVDPTLQVGLEAVRGEDARRRGACGSEERSEVVLEIDGVPHFSSEGGQLIDGTHGIELA